MKKYYRVMLGLKSVNAAEYFSGGFIGAVGPATLSSVRYCAPWASSKNWWPKPTSP